MNTPNELRFTARGIEASFEPACGFLSQFTVTDRGAKIAPLHRAPWAGEVMPSHSPAHHARLRGDFLAAPFGASALGLHGPAANSHWQLMHQAPGLIRAALDQPLMGATVLKELSLFDDHPFVYQRHMFIGGEGAFPVANHAMVSVPNGAELSFSPKRWFETGAQPSETDPSRGRSHLAPKSRSLDPTHFPTIEGGTADLTRFPWAEASENFVSAIEQPLLDGAPKLGWTAVVRPKEGDLFLSLRDPRQLPMTMLWHSHGGRDYAPWNSRHFGCLGIEEGAALPELGLSSQEAPDPLTAAGQPGLLQLCPGGVVTIRHVIGALLWPSGQRVAFVHHDGDLLTIIGAGGARRQLPFQGDWFTR